MPRSTNQKQKLLILQDILLKYTDEAHPMKTEELLDRLHRQGINGERKSLYDDIRALCDQGMDIQLRKGSGYFVASRAFELPELKLLVDAVQSSRFLTAKKSDQLIAKLEQLTSVHEAKLLQRQVLVDRRIKTMNESIYYNVDAIHAAIAAGRQITFQYFEYNVAGEKVLRHNGAAQQVSPHALIWNQENYYLVAYVERYDSIRHYRVDKMLNITQTEQRRAGGELFAQSNPAQYGTLHFGMYSGQTEQVKLRCRNTLAGVIIDRFGPDLLRVPSEDGFFTVVIPVAVSPQFYGWVFGLGDGVQILHPRHVVDGMQEMLRAVAANY